MDEDASSQNAPEEKQSNRLEPVDCVRHQKKKRKASLQITWYLQQLRLFIMTFPFLLLLQKRVTQKEFPARGTERRQGQQMMLQ